jgi:hypothetical protein
MRCPMRSLNMTQPTSVDSSTLMRLIATM